jgi:hypothetical protein
MTEPSYFLTSIGWEFNNYRAKRFCCSASREIVFLDLQLIGFTKRTGSDFRGVPEAAQAQIQYNIFENYGRY